VDSWGKSYDGYYFGSGGLYGMYDECVSTTSTKGNIKGKFCSINMWKNPPDEEEEKGDRSQSAPGQNIPKLTLTLPHQHKLKGLKNIDTRNAPTITINTETNVHIFYTTCIPSTCTDDEFGASLFWTMYSHGYLGLIEACYLEEPEVSYDAAVISFIVVLTLLVVASLLDLYILYSGRTQLTKGHLKYLLVFSAYTNASKIFKINNESPPSTISCLHGMRLAPPILLVGGMYATVARFFLTGVKADTWWYYWEPGCRNYWWKDALLINNISMDMLVVTVGWTLATLTGLLVVFGMWSYNIPYVTDPSSYITWDTMTQLTYGGLHRPAWAAALAWVVYSCHYGYGGLVNGFLSHPSWQPLSRLTYCMYLVALQMQFLIAYTVRVPFYYTNLNKVIEVVGAICVSFPVTVLASLMSEAPIIGLEKLLLGSARKPRPTQTEPTKPTTSDLNHPDEPVGDDMTETTNTTNHNELGDLIKGEKSPSSYMMEDFESNQQQQQHANNNQHQQHANNNQQQQLANNGHDNPTLILEEGLIQRQMNGTNNTHL
ncbi:hypothetical protein Pmani_036797, partial [Petrolisthes manimaculis]